MPNYLDKMYAQARSRILRITATTEADILRAYKSAGENLVRKFNRSREGSATRAYYASYIRALNEEMTSVINKAGLTAAEIPVSLQKLTTEKIFKEAGIDTELVGNFNQSYGKIPKNSMAKIINGNIYKDTTTLSDRIWGSSLRSGADIQGIINAGIANKSSATELARTLQEYVDPNIRKTWNNDKIRSVLGDGYSKWNKNLEYNALRLARTTITHASQLANIEASRKNPYIKSMQWHSVLAHGRTCDICRERDGKIFLLDDVPLDHPNGLCYQTAVLEQTLNEIADDLKKKVEDNSSSGSLLDLSDLLKDWVNKG